MVQLQQMNARLDTLSDELCQVNTCVGRISRHQAKMGGNTMPSTPITPADVSDADDADDDDDVDSDVEDDGDASLHSDDEMST